MPTFEVDDQLHSHPKADIAGLEAMGLWVIAGSWCAAYLTDGFVPRGRALKFGDESVWERLVKAQLVVATPEGYQFHDWDHWNRTASQIAEQRAKSTLKKRDQRARKRALAKCLLECPQGTDGGTDQGSPDAPRARVSLSPSQSLTHTQKEISTAPPAEDRQADSPPAGPVGFVEKPTTVFAQAQLGLTPDEPKPDGEPPSGPTPTREVYEHYVAGWRRVVNGTRPPKLDKKRLRLIKARLAEGWTVDDLKRACDGLWSHTWHIEHRQTSLDLLFRDNAHVEQFLGYLESPPASGTQPGGWDPTGTMEEL